MRANSVLRSLIAMLLSGGGAIGFTAAKADPIADFYRGKTMDFYIGYTVGGGYDTYARLISRFMGAHIPGNPKIVPRNMAGGGSRVAAGYVYNVAPKDGTVLATASQSLALDQAMGDPGIKFDTTKFSWIGNPSVDNNTLATWYTTGVRTIDDARKKEVAVGSTGADPSSQYPKVMNALLGTKFKVVLGYPGANEINLAMEKGELGGRGSNSWTSWKATKPDWLRDHKINILVQVGLEKAPDLQGVPLLMDLASKAEDRTVLRLLSAPITVGRPVFSTPAVPTVRVNALRSAFNAMMRDTKFLEEARKLKLPINPITGEKLQKIVADIVATPKPLASRLAAIIK